MLNLHIILLALLALLFIYFLWSRRRFYKIWWQMPGPLGLPFLGLGLQMMNPEKFLQYMEKQSQNYETPFISWMGAKCFLYVNDPETTRTVFNSALCTNKGDFYNFIVSAIGDGLFTSSSPRWNKHRRLINPAFTQETVNKFLPIFNHEANVFVQNLSQSEGNKVELYGMLKKIVLEAACQTTMGKRMNFQFDSSKEIFTSYNSLIEVCVKRMLSPWLHLDVLYHLTPLYQQQQKVVGILYKFIENLLHNDSNNNNKGKTHSNNNLLFENSELMMTKRTQPNTIEPKETTMQAAHHLTGNTTIKDHWSSNGTNENDSGGAGVDDADDDNDSFGDNGDAANHNANNDSDNDDGNINKSKSHVFIEQVRNCIEQGHLSWKDVRDEANVIIAATFETTSTALYLVCLCLAMHPEYQDKLYSELVDIFHADGDDDDADTAGSSSQRTTHHNNNNSTTSTTTTDKGKQELKLNYVTLDELKRMTFTEMVINEAMRLFAPVPIVLRRTSGDLPLQNGLRIPSGTQIGIDIFNMQRSEKVWGPHARSFKPDVHFADSFERHPFAFVPFTKGLRMCIGYRYALNLMKIMIAKIFLNFRLHTNVQLEDLMVKGTISLKLCHYPLCELQRR